jgi:drug/metabolite transporter (DMT)-like permease
MINPVRDIVPPMLINFWRFCIGTLILIPALVCTGKKQLQELQQRDYIEIALLGCLNIFLAMGAHALCIKYARASTAAILISANPLATNFFSWLILGEKMSGKRISALLLGLSGIIILTMKADNSLDTPLGIAAGLVGMTGFGLYTVLSKKLIHRHGSLVVLVFSCLPALFLYIPFLYFTGSGFIPLSTAWPHIIGAGIIGTGLGYLTFMKALEILSAGRASYLFFFKPPVAIFLAFLFLGEKISTSAVVGMLLIMTGIIIETKRTGQKSKSA